MTFNMFYNSSPSYVWLKLQLEETISQPKVQIYQIFMYFMSNCWGQRIHEIISTSMDLLEIKYKNVVPQIYLNSTILVNFTRFHTNKMCNFSPSTKIWRYIASHRLQWPFCFYFILVPNKYPMKELINELTIHISCERFVL